MTPWHRGALRLYIIDPHVDAGARLQHQRLDLLPFGTTESTPDPRHMHRRAPVAGVLRHVAETRHERSVVDPTHPTAIAVLRHHVRDADVRRDLDEAHGTEMVLRLDAID